MKVIIFILIVVLFIKSIIYKTAFLIMGYLLKEKRNIIPTDEELKECSGHVIKNKWIQILL